MRDAIRQSKLRAVSLASLTKGAGSIVTRLLAITPGFGLQAGIVFGTIQFPPTFLSMRAIGAKEHCHDHHSGGCQSLVRWRLAA